MQAITVAVCAGGSKYVLHKESGEVEVARANEVETRRRAREEVDPAKPPVDTADTPWPGWTSRTYFMSDGGRITHYVAPLPVAPPQAATGEGEGEEAKAEVDGGDGAGGEDEVAAVVGQRVEDGKLEYKVRFLSHQAEALTKGRKRATSCQQLPWLAAMQVRWKGWAPADDTWEPLENLESCPEMIESYKAARAAKAAMAPPPVITSSQKLLSYIKSNPECLAAAENDQDAFLKGFGWAAPTKRSGGGARPAAHINWSAQPTGQACIWGMGDEQGESTSVLASAP